jgi:hypothetical protein
VTVIDVVAGKMKVVYSGRETTHFTHKTRVEPTSIRYDKNSSNQKINAHRRASTPAILVLAFSYIFLLVCALSLKTELACPRELVASFVQGQGQKMALVLRTSAPSTRSSRSI